MLLIKLFVAGTAGFFLLWALIHWIERAGVNR